MKAGDSVTRDRGREMGNPCRSRDAPFRDPGRANPSTRSRSSPHDRESTASIRSSRSPARWAPNPAGFVVALAAGRLKTFAARASNMRLSFVAISAHPGELLVFAAISGRSSSILRQGHCGIPEVIRCEARARASEFRRNLHRDRLSRVPAHGLDWSRGEVPACRRRTLFAI